MSRFPFRALLAIPVIAVAMPVAAQSFDPLSQAKGWAHQDRDFSFTFYDPAGRALVTWDKSFGTMNTLSLAKLKDEPSMWLMDRYNNAWIVSGDTLYFVTKDGKVDRKEKLPAPVSDLAWDAQTGFVLCYRTAAPFLEMRDLKDGGVIWSYGQKPKKGEVPGAAKFRVVINARDGGDSVIYLSEGANLDLTALSGKKGSPMGQVVFSYNDKALGALTYGDAGPGALCHWIGKQTLFAAVPSTALPAGAAPGLNGLLLAKLDLSMGTIVFEPTGLTPDNQFIGVVDGQAVFIKAAGGLAFVPVQ